MNNVAQRLVAWLAVARHSQRGQGLAEYSMILALVALVAIAGLLVLGADINSTLTSIGSTVQSVH